MIANKF